MNGKKPAANDKGIPARLIRFVLRLHTLLRPGWVYNVTIIVPTDPNANVRWAFNSEAKIENEE